MSQRLRHPCFSTSTFTSSTSPPAHTYAHISETEDSEHKLARRIKVALVFFFLLDYLADSNWNFRPGRINSELLPGRTAVLFHLSSVVSWDVRVQDEEAVAKTNCLGIRWSICAESGFTKQCKRRKETLSAVAEKDLDVLWVDDVTGKEWPWPAVRRARHEELKDLRELGVDEQVNEQAAIARYEVDRH